MRFIVKNNRLSKFHSSLEELAQKFDITNFSVDKVIPDDVQGLDDNVIITKLEVPTGDKKLAEKYLLFNQEIFVKMSLDYFPSYCEAPIIRK